MNTFWGWLVRQQWITQQTNILNKFESCEKASHANIYVNRSIYYWISKHHLNKQDVFYKNLIGVWTPASLGASLSFLPGMALIVHQNRVSA